MSDYFQEGQRAYLEGRSPLDFPFGISDIEKEDFMDGYDSEIERHLDDLRDSLELDFD